jgi:L-ribulose-5-phosphate 3-epimerase
MKSRKHHSTSRREFLFTTTLGAAGLVCAQTGCKHGGDYSTSAKQPVIAFNTANLAGQVTGFRFELKNWGQQHQKTIAATDEKAWAAICREIASTGFRAVEVWEAHAAPESLDQQKAKAWGRILAEHNLKPVGYAGRLRRETLQLCQWLQIPRINGSIGSLKPEEASALCREFGIAFNLENHPEKAAAEILTPIGGGNEWLGVCVDTGWLGTQGVSAPAMIRTLGRLVRHTHIKDVKGVGAHETCLLGTGVVDVDACLQALKEVGYSGVYSWEDEPEDRNPFDSAMRNREWLQARVP